MAIRLMEDLGAPLAVTVVDLATEAMIPAAGEEGVNWNEMLSYVLAVGGYAAAWMRFGGDFMKNVGIASMPWAAKSVYRRFMKKESGVPVEPVEPVTRRLAYRSVSRYPAPANKSPFQGVKLT